MQVLFPQRSSPREWTNKDTFTSALIHHAYSKKSFFLNDDIPSTEFVDKNKVRNRDFLNSASAKRGLDHVSVTLDSHHPTWSLTGSRSVSRPPSRDAESFQQQRALPYECLEKPGAFSNHAATSE